ncbi:hypothetical protein CI109_107288 [Kwoniella shandongensis]|uniref:Histone-lysine N-methyltransferase SET5 n=1 Tax=Kwoniella shandongensis TaxID=1734106 RepID=A0A5M6C3H7_9TREE|nr:uncharacterized protein CI109_002572 [Kwoniella shandongensis]KAA5529230.1 hypothetical protein CI109_002572 [Kwoniella shandongensis]
MANDTTTTSPADDVLNPVVSDLRAAHPSLGITKLFAQFKVDHPEWAVSEKRFRKALQVTGGSIAPQNGTVGNANDPSMPLEAGLIADTGIDPSIDVATIAPMVKVKMFPGGKGKGLVAKEKLQQGEVLWQEEPWIVTADPELYPYLTSKQMCSQCFTLFPLPNPPLSVSCSYCDTAHFCNRLCYAKARSSTAAHSDLLCPGQNPDAVNLLSFIHQKRARSVDAIARIIARWRGEREWGEKSKADEIEQRVWKGMARVSQQKKEMERKEWEFVGEMRIEEWKLVHMLICKVLNPQPTDENYKKFQKLLIAKHPRKAKPTPLTEEEVERWFSLESFLQLYGLVGLNQEDSGGLYALHAHLNHSCEPNIQVRNLPKSFVPPSPSDLPCDLPPPTQPGNRGTNKLTILARRTIHPGDELLISYVNFAKPREERRNDLREGYGFWCSCPRCVREKKEEEKAAQAQAKAAA